MIVNLLRKDKRIFKEKNQNAFSKEPNKFKPIIFFFVVFVEERKIFYWFFVRNVLSFTENEKEKINGDPKNEKNKKNKSWNFKTFITFCFTNNPLFEKIKNKK